MHTVTHEVRGTRPADFELEEEDEQAMVQAQSDDVMAALERLHLSTWCLPQDVEVQRKRPLSFLILSFWETD